MDDFMATEQENVQNVSSSEHTASVQDMYKAARASQFAHVIALRESALMEHLEKEKSARKHRKVGLFTRVAAVAAIGLGQFLISTPAQARRDTDAPAQTTEVAEAAIPGAENRIFLPIVLKGDIKDRAAHSTAPAPTETHASPTTIPSPEPTSTPEKNKFEPDPVSAAVRNIDPNTWWASVSQIANGQPVELSHTYDNPGENDFHNITTSEQSEYWLFDSENHIPEDQRTIENTRPAPRREIIASPASPARLRSGVSGAGMFPPHHVQEISAGQAFTYTISGHIRDTAPGGGGYGQIMLSPLAGGNVIRLEVKGTRVFLINGVDSISETYRKEIDTTEDGSIDYVLSYDADHQHIMVQKPAGQNELIDLLEEPLPLNRQLTETAIYTYFDGQNSDINVTNMHFEAESIPSALTRESLAPERHIAHGIFAQTEQKIGLSGGYNDWQIIGPHEGAQYIDYHRMFTPITRLDARPPSRIEPDKELTYFTALRNANIESAVPIYLESYANRDFDLTDVKRDLDAMLQIAEDTNFPVLLTLIDRDGNIAIDEQCFNSVFVNTDGSRSANQEQLFDNAVRYVAQKAPVLIALPDNVQPGVTDKILSHIDRARAVGPVIGANHDLSQWTLLENRAFAQAIKERGLDLYPRRIADGRSSIEEQIQVCKEIGGCEYMSFEIAHHIAGETQDAFEGRKKKAIYYVDHNSIVRINEPNFQRAVTTLQQ